MLSGIIADDLTGAADTGIQFAKRNLYTILLPFSADTPSRQLREAQIIALNTNTRGMRPELAYDTVKRATALLERLHPLSIYKKIDSTLRGNVGVEIEAVMDATGNEIAILSPAFPACGRTTVNGVHLVNGQPLSETEAASDPVSPVCESHIPTLIRAQTGLKTGHIDLKEIRRSPASLRRSILQHIKNGEKIIVFDAVTDRDLSSIAEAGMSMPSPPLMVGSAGLADQLSRLLTLSERAADQPVAYESIGEGAILIISGSLSAVTSNQLDEIRRAGRGKIVSIAVHKLIEDQNHERESEIVSEIISAAEAGKAAGVQSVIENRCDEKELPLRIVEYLGRLAHRIIGECPQPIRGLILTGGDTALAVFEHLGISQVRLMDEILPGIPRGLVVSGKFSGLTVVTKAGAFGNERALVHCVDLLMV